MVEADGAGGQDLLGPGPLTSDPILLLLELFQGDGISKSHLDQFVCALVEFAQAGLLPADLLVVQLSGEGDVLDHGRAHLVDAGCLDWQVIPELLDPFLNR
ncbi:MAG TPA: hypothetical protein VEW93_07025 [Acidimicrobiales bacterium]|nr:hypothetical protein [Acidimicrobiales bacterium]